MTFVKPTEVLFISDNLLFLGLMLASFTIQTWYQERMYISPWDEVFEYWKGLIGFISGIVQKPRKHCELLIETVR